MDATAADIASAGFPAPHVLAWAAAFFVDQFVFLAGLLFAAVHGPGRLLAMKRKA